LYADSLPGLIVKRLRVLDPFVSLPAFFDFETLRSDLMVYPQYIIFTIIRSWANGWTTTHRMHEPVKLTCLFGCTGCKDELRHYLECDRLWRALKTTLKSVHESISSPFFSACITDKLAITSRTGTRILELSVLTYAYHALKNNHLPALKQNCQSRNMQDTARITHDVLKAAVLRYMSVL
jgi:hypothetical protein